MAETGRCRWSHPQKLEASRFSLSHYFSYIWCQRSTPQNGSFHKPEKYLRVSRGLKKHLANSWIFSQPGECVAFPIKNKQTNNQGHVALSSLSSALHHAGRGKWLTEVMNGKQTKLMCTCVHTRMPRIEIQ